METNRTALEYVTAEKKIHSLLGLSQRGGHIASGEFMTEKAVKDGRAFLCIVAEDASDNTKKMFHTLLKLFYQFICLLVPVEMIEKGEI